MAIADKPPANSGNLTSYLKGRGHRDERKFCGIQASVLAANRDPSGRVRCVAPGHVTSDTSLPLYCNRDRRFRFSRQPSGRDCPKRAAVSEVLWRERRALHLRRGGTTCTVARLHLR